jgi:hypothetical protein
MKVLNTQVSPGHSKNCSEGTSQFEILKTLTCQHRNASIGLFRNNEIKRLMVAVEVLLNEQNFLNTRYEEQVTNNRAFL